MARDRKLERGYSFAEIVVVVAIAAALLMLAVPVIQSGDQLGSAVREVTNDAVEARSLAKANWTTVTFDMDVAGSRWRKVLGGVTPVVTQETDAEGWKSLPVGIQFQSVAGLSGDPVFQANGRLAADVQMRMVLNTDVWVLDFQELTGRISASEL